MKPWALASSKSFHSPGKGFLPKLGDTIYALKLNPKVQTVSQNTHPLPGIWKKVKVKQFSFLIPKMEKTISIKVNQNGMAINIEYHVFIVHLFC